MLSDQTVMEATRSAPTTIKSQGLDS
jgi:hypothetical protein